MEMTSLAENSWKELEIALNEQNLVSNSFTSTLIELKQSGKFWKEGRRPPWNTTYIGDDLNN